MTSRSWFAAPGTHAVPVMAALTIGMLVGCGRSDSLPRGAVEGTVTFNGDPLAEGIIRFIPSGETQGPMAETAIRDGVFAMPKASGPCVGTQRVEILAFRKTGRKIMNEGVENEEVEQFIPARYNASSELSATIKAGANALAPFVLADGPR